MTLLNSKKLAKFLMRAPSYVSAMKRAGFRMTHGMRTDPQAALDWLKDNPGFRTDQSYPSQHYPSTRRHSKVSA